MIPAFISSLRPWVIIFWIVAFVAVVVSVGWLVSSRLDVDRTERLRLFECLLGVPEGAAILERHPALAHWWDRMAARPSLPATAPA